LLIGGGGWLNDEEESAIKAALSSGLVILKPNKYVEDSDLASFYSSASCLVMPSHYEGFGIPPLQAMACGTPVVVADNSSLHEIFGACAYLVDANDTQSISKGILAALSMISSESEVYNTKANYVVGSHSWQVAAERLLKLVDEVNGV
jgi:alpha-1,3-rhamnosyl/mannosyltransferase